MRKINLLDGKDPRACIQTPAACFVQDGVTQYQFDTKLEQFDTMLDWLYANTTERFNFSVLV